jgi:glycosyltransferase involved in cell wall biosynthesis
MAVNNAISGDWTVQSPNNILAKQMAHLRPYLSELWSKSLKTTEPGIISTSLMPSIWPQRLKDYRADIINLHWVNDEMMSISDIGKIPQPVVWTLHDMWAFCGAEHTPSSRRWVEGYWHNNRPDYERCFDLNRWTWERKRKHWKIPFQIVTPSHWLADCVKESALMRNWPVSVIPNPIDTEIWQPVEKKIARQLINLPTDVPLILFGAMGGTADPNKGFDLLKTSLNNISKEIPELELVVFGQVKPKHPLDFKIPVHYMGILHDSLSLRVLYSAADAMVVPSRQEAFGQTASEAHACGTPVIAFNVGGLKDIVDHKATGYLAEPYEVEDLSSGIKWVLGDSNRKISMGEEARKRAISHWSYSKIGQLYKDLYSVIKT